jgi:hypothetical protein
MPNSRKVNSRSKSRSRRPANITRMIGFHNQPDAIVRVVGKGLFQLNPTGGSYGSIQLNPGNFNGTLGTTALGYQEFRFTKLMLRVHPLYGVSQITVGYFKDVPASIPASFNGIYSSTNSLYISPSETVPQTLTLGKSDLLGGTRVWYQRSAVVGSNTGDDVFQGSIFFVNSGTPTTASGPLTFEFAYEVELRGPTQNGIGEIPEDRTLNVVSYSKSGSHVGLVQKPFSCTEDKSCKCTSH